MTDPLDGISVATVVDRVAASVRPTTFIESERLDRAIGHDVRVTLVSETFQHTGSFKFRAAIAVALHAEAPRLLTVSSGNFGAALAAACQRTGRGCTVVMPAKSAAVKIRAVRSYGAHVELIDTALTSRAARLEELRRADPAARVASPYDDPYVIAGNASLGWEIFGRPPERQPELLLVPVGGGGLASGLVVARNALGAATAIWGAEPALANDAARSLRSGRLESNAQAEPPTLCDGARTASLGQRNFEILKVGLAGILEVDETAVVAAVRLLFEAANLKAEPTGALPLAALLSAPERFAGRRVACVVSGGNVDGELYAKLLAG